MVSFSKQELLQMALKNKPKCEVLSKMSRAELAKFIFGKNIAKRSPSPSSPKISIRTILTESKNWIKDRPAFEERIETIIGDCIKSSNRIEELEQKLLKCKEKLKNFKLDDNDESGILKKFKDLNLDILKLKENINLLQKTQNNVSVLRLEQEFANLKKTCQEQLLQKLPIFEQELENKLMLAIDSKLRQPQEAIENRLILSFDNKFEQQSIRISSLDQQLKSFLQKQPDIEKQLEQWTARFLNIEQQLDFKTLTQKFSEFEQEMNNKIILMFEDRANTLQLENRLTAEFDRKIEQQSNAIRSIEQTNTQKGIDLENRIISTFDQKLFALEQEVNANILNSVDMESRLAVAFDRRLENALKTIEQQIGENAQQVSTEMENRLTLLLRRQLEEQSIRFENLNTNDLENRLTLTFNEKWNQQSNALRAIEQANLQNSIEMENRMAIAFERQLEQQSNALSMRFTQTTTEIEDRMALMQEQHGVQFANVEQQNTQNSIEMENRLAIAFERQLEQQSARFNENTREIENRLNGTVSVRFANVEQQMNTNTQNSIEMENRLALTFNDRLEQQVVRFEQNTSQQLAIAEEQNRERLADLQFSLQNLSESYRQFTDSVSSEQNEQNQKALDMEQRLAIEYDRKATDMQISIQNQITSLVQNSEQLQQSIDDQMSAIRENNLQSFQDLNNRITAQQEISRTFRDELQIQYNRLNELAFNLSAPRPQLQIEAAPLPMETNEPIADSILELKSNLRRLSEIQSQMSTDLDALQRVEEKINRNISNKFRIFQLRVNNLIQQQILTLSTESIEPYIKRAVKETIERQQQENIKRIVIKTINEERRSVMRELVRSPAAQSVQKRLDRLERQVNIIAVDDPRRKIARRTSLNIPEIPPMLE